MERRLADGGGQTGWSRAWVVNYWTHLHEGDQAYESMSVLFRQSTFPNLMDTHPPGVFQIDGNLGGANGMLEALVQSRWYPDHYEVDLCPHFRALGAGVRYPEFACAEALNSIYSGKREKSGYPVGALLRMAYLIFACPKDST